jgi:pyruvate,water dikinase
MLKQSRAYQLLHGALKHVTPLHLLDPRADDFRPETCTTYHDITRFAHEKAMTELFQGFDQMPVEEGARLLKTTIPLEIYLLDVGGGLTVEVGHNFEVRPEQLASRPMAAYWRGAQVVGWKGPKPIDMKGFVSVVMGTGAGGENFKERLKERNYAIIASDYMNLSTRLGFHFATIDSYLGTPDDSYVSLTFFGGGAEVLRRIRRVRFLAKVLAHVDFQVELKNDSLTARIDRLEAAILEEKLDILGRLMMVSKQMDMVMFNDAMVDFYYKEFIKEGYNLRL